MKTTSRRAILAGIAAAPALAAPAIAATSSGDEVDPVFAAIERHRAVCDFFDSAIVPEQNRLQRLIPRERRRAIAFGDENPNDDPRWTDHCRRYRLNSEQRDDATGQMIDAPTSLAGLVALFDYFDEWLEHKCNGTWEDAWGLPDAEDVVLAIGDVVRRLAGAVS